MLEEILKELPPSSRVPSSLSRAISYLKIAHIALQLWSSRHPLKHMIKLRDKEMPRSVKTFKVEKWIIKLPYSDL